MDASVEPSEKPYEFDSYPQRLLIALILLIISISGIFGNRLVIFAVVASRRLRNVTNVFVVNLAFADFLVCFFTPATIIATVSPDGWPSRSEAYCAVGAMIVYTSIGVSLYNLALITVNRWILVTKPVGTYQKIFGKQVVVISWLAFLWIFPSVLVLMPVFMKIGSYGYNEKYHSCSDREGIGSDANALGKIYDLIILMGIFPVPAILLVVCYWKIYKHVLKHAKRLGINKEESDALSMTDSQVVTKSTEDVGNISESNEYPSLPRTTASDSEAADRSAVPLKERRRKKKTKTVKTNLSRRQIEITKNLFYVLCAFLVCITPYLILLVFDDDGPLAPVAPYAACCLMVNNCINWIIYATKHPHFRVVFRCILTGRLRDIPEPAEWLRNRGDGSSSCPCC